MDREKTVRKEMEKKVVWACERNGTKEKDRKDFGIPRERRRRDRPPKEETRKYRWQRTRRKTGKTYNIDIDANFRLLHLKLVVYSDLAPRVLFKETVTLCTITGILNWFLQVFSSAFPLGTDVTDGG